MKDLQNVAVCGLGKLGAPIAAVLAESGVNVVGYDVDEKKVQAINEGWIEPLVDEPGLEASIAKLHRGGTLKLVATNTLAAAVAATQACIFIVPTPSKQDGSFDHSAVIDCVREVASLVKSKPESDEPYVFIVASTVMPTCCEREIAPLLVDAFMKEDPLQKLGCHYVPDRPYEGRPFGLVYMPLFIALGSVMHDLRFPDIVLLGHMGFGVENFVLAEAVAAMWRWVCGGGVRRMSLIEAEIAKISLNCAVTAKISLANQVEALSRRLGADPHIVLEAVGADKRIGHAAFRPGLPFGGPCFPRDNRMFCYVAGQHGCSAPLSEAVDEQNEITMGEIADAVMAMKPASVGILGQSYKPGTRSMEESPGLRLARFLQSCGPATGKSIEVRTHDPMALHSNSLEEVLECSVVVVMTPWPEYAKIKSKIPKGCRLVDPMKVVRSWE